MKPSARSGAFLVDAFALASTGSSGVVISIGLRAGHQIPHARGERCPSWESDAARADGRTGPAPPARLAVQSNFTGSPGTITGSIGCATTADTGFQLSACAVRGRAHGRRR